MTTSRIFHRCRRAAAFSMSVAGSVRTFLPFVDRGLESVGVEIDPQIVKVAREIAVERELPLRFEEGSNRAIPFPDDSLIS